MKKLVLVFLVFLSAYLQAQVYIPSQAGTPTNKSLAVSQAAPTDSRSFFWDQNLFLYRPYNGTSEVLTYLSLPKYRVGGYDIIVHSGGTLNPDGSYTGGTNAAYWFKNCTDDSCLVLKQDTSASGGSPNTNIGEGYKLAVDSTNDVKTVFPDYGILIDSTTNEDGITYILDSATVFPDIRATISIPASRYIETSTVDSLRLFDVDTLHTYRLIRKGIVSEYYYDRFDLTSPDDSVMCLISQGEKRLKKFNTGSVYVKDFGATANDFTDDDAPAFNKMFAFIKSQKSTMFRVILEEGSYQVYSQILLPDSNSSVGTHTNIEIIGNSTQIFLVGSNKAIFSRSGTGVPQATVENYWLPNYNFIIKGIKFFGDGTNVSTGQKAIDVTGTYSMVIEDCGFQYFDTAIVQRFALNPTIRNNWFQGNRKVCIYGGTGVGVLNGGTICNSGYNVSLITKNRFNNYNGSFAAVMVDNPIGANIDDNISEGNHPKYAVWISGKESNCQTVNYISKLWVESGGGTNLKTTAVYSESRNNLYIRDLDIQTTSAYVLDCRNADVDSKTHRYVLDGIRTSGLDTSFLVGSSASSTSFEIKNITLGESVYNYYYTPSVWGGAIPYNVTVEAYSIESGEEGKIQGYSQGLTIMTGQQGGVGANGAFRLQGKLLANEDNTYQWGGFGGAYNSRPVAFFMGTFGAAVDPIGSYWFSDAVGINDRDSRMVRDSAGQIGFKGIGSDYINIKAARGLFTLRSGYASFIPFSALGDYDFITKKNMQDAIDTLAKPTPTLQQVTTVGNTTTTSVGTSSFFSAGNAGYGFGDQGNQKGMFAGGAALVVVSGSGGNLIFGTASDAQQFGYFNGSNNVLSLTGYLGVGTATPSQRLDVKGQIQVDTVTTGTNTDSVVVINNGLIKKVLQSSIGAAKLNTSDTASMLSAYQSALNARTAAIALKLNISDTSTMLTAYQTALNNRALNNNALMTGLLSVTGTTQQLKLSYNGSFFSDFTVNSTGDLAITPNSGTTVFSGAVRQGSAATNFYVASANNASVTTSTAQMLSGGATQMNLRVGMRGGTNSTIPTGNDYTSFVIGEQTAGESTSGAHRMFSQMTIKPLNVTAGAATVTRGATLLITNAGNAVTSGSNDALLVDTGNVRINTGAFIIGGSAGDASSILDAQSTTKGVLWPRMTTTQKNAISSPAEGLIVYDLTLHKLCVFTGTVWETVTSL